MLTAFRDWANVRQAFQGITTIQKLANVKCLSTVVAREMVTDSKQKQNASKPVAHQTRKMFAHCLQRLGLVRQAFQGITTIQKLANVKCLSTVVAWEMVTDSKQKQNASKPVAHQTRKMFAHCLQRLGLVRQAFQGITTIQKLANVKCLSTVVAQEMVTDSKRNKNASKPVAHQTRKTFAHCLSRLGLVRQAFQGITTIQKLANVKCLSTVVAREMVTDSKRNKNVSKLVAHQTRKTFAHCLQRLGLVRQAFQGITTIQKLANVKCLSTVVAREMVTDSKQKQNASKPVAHQTRKMFAHCLQRLGLVRQAFQGITTIQKLANVKCLSTVVAREMVTDSKQKQNASKPVAHQTRKTFAHCLQRLGLVRQAFQGITTIQKLANVKCLSTVVAREMVTDSKQKQNASKPVAHQTRKTFAHCLQRLGLVRQAFQGITTIQKLANVKCLSTVVAREMVTDSKRNKNVSKLVAHQTRKMFAHCLQRLGLVRQAFQGITTIQKLANVKCLSTVVAREMVTDSKRNKNASKPVAHQTRKTFAHCLQRLDLVRQAFQGITTIQKLANVKCLSTVVAREMVTDSKQKQNASKPVAHQTRKMFAHCLQRLGLVRQAFQGITTIQKLANVKCLSTVVAQEMVTDSKRNKNVSKLVAHQTRKMFAHCLQRLGLVRQAFQGITTIQKLANVKCLSTVVAREMVTDSKQKQNASKPVAHLTRKMFAHSLQRLGLVRQAFQGITTIQKLANVKCLSTVVAQEMVTDSKQKQNASKPVAHQTRKTFAHCLQRLGLVRQAFQGITTIQKLANVKCLSTVVAREMVTDSKRNKNVSKLVAHQTRKMFAHCLQRLGLVRQAFQGITTIQKLANVKCLSTVVAREMVTDSKQKQNASKPVLANSSTCKVLKLADAL